MVRADKRSEIQSLQGIGKREGRDQEQAQPDRGYKTVLDGHVRNSLRFSPEIHRSPSDAVKKRAKVYEFPCFPTEPAAFFGGKRFPGLTSWPGRSRILLETKGVQLIFSETFERSKSY
jgi:hypothetical protein